jgi:hypothetical protein
MNNTFVNFTKAMEVIDTIPGYVETPLVPTG